MISTGYLYGGRSTRYYYSVGRRGHGTLGRDSGPVGPVVRTIGPWSGPVQSLDGLWTIYIASIGPVQASGPLVWTIGRLVWRISLRSRSTTMLSENSNEDNYKSNATAIRTVKGRKVPLQISKGNDWRRLNNIRSITIGSTYLKSKKIMKCAVHIFNSVFRKRYDFLNYNCHAFVCYLLFSISLLDDSTGRYLVSRQPSSHQERNWLTSLLIYKMWCVLMTVPAPKSTLPGLAPTKTWDINENVIYYPDVIPPQIMYSLLNPSEAPSQQQIRASVKHVEHKSHAAHVDNQPHHDIMQNIQNQIITATITQQAAAQATLSQASTGTASWNNPGSNPSAFGLMPGMGLGF